jgi:hypothetical protein
MTPPLRADACRPKRAEGGYLQRGPPMIARLIAPRNSAGLAYALLGAILAVVPRG